MKKFTMVLGSLVLVMLLLTAVVFADGTETLGDPSIPIASGTGIVAAGVGLDNSQPGTININVPAGATVNQVLVYWNGTVTSNAPSDNTIVVGGNSVTGTLIGGQAYFFSFNGKEFYASNYRADITNLSLVSAGANSISVEGLDNKDGDGDGADTGAGIMVIYDDGSATASDITVKDGLDLAYDGFPEPRHSTIPQTFTFTEAASERTATLVIFASSVGAGRPNTIALDSNNGDIPDVIDPLGSNDGDLWDTLELPVQIPAGATEITVEIVSGSTSAGNPASLNWSGAGLSVPPSVLGCIGDYVWFDENGDTIQDEDPNTHGLENVTVRLFRQISPDTYELVGTTTTDAVGWYQFCELPEGNYVVDVHNPDIDPHFANGWLSTTKNDPYPAPPPVGGAINLGPGEIYEDADFGYDDLGGLVALGDYVWYDANKNGVNDEPDDHAIACVTVFLYTAGNPNPIGQTNTDSWGIYGYAGLPPTGAPNGYSTEVDQTDPDIDNFIDFLQGRPVTPTCNKVNEIFPTTTTTVMQPLADITTPPTATMQDSNIPGTTDLTLDYAFWKDPTALSLASFEVTEAASSPATWALVAGTLVLLATGAWLHRRRQTVK